MRRRGLPGWLPRSSHSVERAFTPAAHWQFQNRALPRREHPREGHGPPLRTGTDATAIRLVRNTKFIRRGGFHICPGTFAPPQSPRDDLRPKSRACGPVGLRNAPAGAVQASSPTGGCVMRGRSIPVGRGIAAVRRGPRPKNKIPKTSRRAVFPSRPPGRAPHLNSEL